METFRGSRDDLVRVLRQIPAALAGGPDPFGIARDIQLRCGVALLSQIQQDFITKSRGGTGRDGIKWAPLLRSTVAQRRTTGQERKSLGISGKRTRGLLTPAQDKRWRAIFASRVAKLRLMMSDGEAKARAAQIAWTILKSEGAVTKLQVLGGRQVDIGRDTSRMFRSLSPGVEDRPSGESEQVFEVPPGAVIVGSNVPYFPAFNKRRPVWPADGQLPPAWADAVAIAMRAGITRAVALIVERGRR
jgi:hypothetical protein